MSGFKKIYRAISVDEFMDLVGDIKGVDPTYIFRGKPGFFEGKQFGFTIEDIRSFIEDEPFLEGEQAIISAYIPERYTTGDVPFFDVSEDIDNLQFPNGVLTVDREGMDELNGVFEDLALEEVINKDDE